MFKDDTIVCRHLNKRRENERFTLYRYRFTFGGEAKKTRNDEGGIKWQRIQFPIRPAFAMTVNKSQGVLNIFFNSN